MNVVFTGEENQLRTKQTFGGKVVEFVKQKDGKYVAENVPENIAQNIVKNPLYQVVTAKDEPAFVKKEFKIDENPEKPDLRPKVTKFPTRERKIANAPPQK